MGGNTTRGRRLNQITPELLLEVVEIYTNAPDPDTARQMIAERFNVGHHQVANYLRQARESYPDQLPTFTTSGKPVAASGEHTNLTVVRKIAEYLELCRRGRAVEQLAVSLGAKGKSNDPEEIRTYVKELRESLPTRSALDALQTTQRIRDLLAAADEMDNTEESPRGTFVRYGLAFARERGISYGAFRDCGVPASVLTDAGIPRTGL